ncbi:MAG: SusC/RagA family TonB-linked outer membrane protein [Bacteroidales bacterium]|jgi:TonB-linked SusC/RagA family outer membrane protein
MKRYILFKTSLLIFLLLGFAFSGFSQQLDVRGVVTDAKDGSTIPGVTIQVKDTFLGTLTDIDGNYSISVNKGETLVFSFIGYESQEIVADNNVINVALKTAVTDLDEVLVIGYGTQKKTDKTGAITHLTSDELNKGLLTDPIQAMQGKAAGVLITKKGGDPNAGFAVKIRGSAGFDSNTSPLYVIDGVPNADPTAIAPGDIETYNVLKDAASTAIYGSQGANGVILITTKKGSAKKGATVTGFSSQVSFDKVAKKLDVLSASELRDFANQKLQNSLAEHPNWTVDSIFTDGGANTDWQDEIYRIGITTNNNLNFSGGSENSSYYASVTHANWQGVMKGTEKERTTAKLNVTHKALNDKLNLSGNIMTSFENNDYENYDGYDKDDIIYQAISHNPTDPVYNPDGTYNKTQREFNYENPLAVIDMITNVRNLKSYLGNIRADYEIISDLTLSVNASYLRNDSHSKYFRPKGVYASADDGYGRHGYTNNEQKTIETTLTYIKNFDKHNLDLIGGHSWQENNYNGFWAQGSNAQSPFIGAENLSSLADIKYGDIGSYRGMSRLIGMFVRAQYNFNSTYYASASLRRDGSTKFGENNKWGLFPTFALGWNMQNENFLKDVSWLNQLKLRASYGVSGNQAIGEYRSRLSWTPSGLAINPETGEQVISYQPAWNSNPNLKWERTSEINLGIDFAIFNSRISGSIELYSKNTTDLLGQYSVPVPPNLASTTFANSGAVTNKGVELFVQAFVIDNKNFSWKTSLTASHNKSKFTDLGEFATDSSGVRHEGWLTGRGMIGAQYYVTGIAVGHGFGEFYLPEFVSILDGKPVYRSLSGGYTTNLVEAKRSFVGSATPVLEIGWSNSFVLFNNWTVDLAFRSMIGNKVFNATRMFFDVPGNMPSINGTPDAIDWYEKGRTDQSVIFSDYYLEDASFLRLDYLAIGYNFNVEKIKWLKGLNLSIMANNLFTITGYSGIDPETFIDGLSYGVDQYNVYPKTRTVSIGLNAKF